MTPEERAQKLSVSQELCWDDLIRAVNELIAEEREACAKLADWPKPTYYLSGPALNDQAVLCNGIAAAIRART
jgi:sugar phosphate isomerase/epimerase